VLAIPIEPSIPAVASGHVGALEQALRTERRLLDDLLEVLLRQRSGVATDDLAVVDDSVFAAQRVLHTLSEARRRRRSLLCIVAGDENASLAELEVILGAHMTLSLRSAVGDLKVAAEQLAGELERNRRVLQGAITSGDQLIRALTGQKQATAPVYVAQGSGEVAQGTLLVDRQV